MGNYIEGKNNKWEYVIGLEIHAQVSSKAKLFSGSATGFGAGPNSQVSWVDAAMPGMLPVLNYKAVEQAIKTGLAINAKINKYSAFDRKNYFYADLPQGYQISQFYHPIVSDGYAMIQTEAGEKKIRINRIHLEQDAGKSMHDQSPTSTYIDLNRSGVALMEIVTEPDLSSPEEAAEYVKKLRAILRYVGSCDGDMEKGSMRCDANVSVRVPGSPLGTRCELKNINSIKNIVKAIEYEALRQVEILENYGVINQETRLFDASTGETRTMRSKEDALDYRYFPDPDLLPIKLEQKTIDDIAKTLPELPDAKIERYKQDFKISDYDAGVIAADKYIADYYELAATKANPQLVANWLTGELFAALNKHNQTLSESNISAEHLAELVSLIEDETISGKIAKTVFEEMFKSAKSPKKIVDEKGLVQITDPKQMKEVIAKIMNNNQDSVTAYKAGKIKLFGFFVGQVMKETGGKANPGLVNKLLKEELDSSNM